MVMRKFSLIIFLLLSVFLIAQDIIVKEIFSTQTKERNKKLILLNKKIKGIEESYFLQARNHESKDFSSCEWESDIKQNDFHELLSALSSLELDSEFENTNFKLRSVRNKVYFYFNHTKCKGGHKTHYFQKKCSRLLSFFLTKEQVTLLIKSVERQDENIFLKNSN